MKCSTPNELMLFDILSAILKDLPGVSCEEFHHAIRDRHEAHEECPVQKRFTAAVDAALMVTK